MAQTLYFVRHAQGYHNLCEANHAIIDPMLTDLGKAQCQELAAEFPYADQIDLIVASPLKRTIYTALIGFEHVIKEKNLKVIALPELQETSDLPCDTGSNRSELEREFADYPVDLALVEDGWNSNTGKFTPTADKVSQRAHEARLWLRNRPEKRIAVVTHGGFLHYFTEDWSGIVNVTAGSGWHNAEWRAYNFVPESVENASVIETSESRQRRKGQERPLSEAEQRNLREVASKTWESLGYIRRPEDVHETPSVVRQIATTVSA